MLQLLLVLLVLRMLQVLQVQDSGLAELRGMDREAETASGMLET